MKKIKLSNGVEMPQLGYGVYQVEPDECERIEMLVDAGSFEEYDMFKLHRCTNFGMEKKQYLGDGVVAGSATIAGRLSELALGWATYNGDHMSMYGVNASIPKTLVRYLVQYEASKTPEALRAVLLDVLDTPVSPELLPPEPDGTIAQKTEDLVGPYELHDFF